MVNMNDFEKRDLSQEQVISTGMSLMLVDQELMLHSYNDVYVANGYSHLVFDPDNRTLNDGRSQALFKHYIACAQEELAEAIEAFEKGNDGHYFEELLDGLHFLMNAYLCINMYPKLELGDLYIKALNSIANDKVPLSQFRVNLYLDMGLACNCLKQKAWKQTHMPSDANVFQRLLDDIAIGYIVLFALEGITPVEIVTGFFQKTEVNKFRIKSKY